MKGFIKAVCKDSSGRVKWIAETENLIVNEGLAYCANNDLAAAVLYVGLKDTGTVAAGDTLASHAGWAEISAIYSGNRPVWTENGGGGAALSNSSSVASYTITGPDDVYGAFLCTAASGTTGTLIGAGNFTEGTRSVVASDTLEVTYTVTFAAS